MPGGGDGVSAGRFSKLRPRFGLRLRPESPEPCGALAESDPSGRVTLWSANQSVFRVQANVCESLGLPMAQLRCLTPRVGAGFGNKMQAAMAAITPESVKAEMHRKLAEPGRGA